MAIGLGVPFDDAGVFTDRMTELMGFGDCEYSDENLWHDNRGINGFNVAVMRDEPALRSVSAAAPLSDKERAGLEKAGLDPDDPPLNSGQLRHGYYHRNAAADHDLERHVHRERGPLEVVEHRLVAVDPRRGDALVEEGPAQARRAVEAPYS